jgi:deoxycytidylate deaminase
MDTQIRPIKTYPLAKVGKCAKANVVATLTTIKGEVFRSNNYCLTPQSTCPRDIQGYKSGEGYHLCKQICNQPGHAEENVIYFAKKEGANVRGGRIVVDYSWICNNCKSVCNDNGINKVEVKQHV